MKLKNLRWLSVWGRVEVIVREDDLRVGIGVLIQALADNLQQKKVFLKLIFFLFLAIF